MKITKITIGAEASINFQKGVYHVEVEGATQAELGALQAKCVQNAQAIAQELADAETASKNLTPKATGKPAPKADVEMAFYPASGDKVLTKDKVHLNKMDNMKLFKAGKKAYQLTIAEVHEVLKVL